MHRRQSQRDQERSGIKASCRSSFDPKAVELTVPKRLEQLSTLSTARIVRPRVARGALVPIAAAHALDIAEVCEERRQVARWRSLRVGGLDRGADDGEGDKGG